MSQCHKGESDLGFRAILDITQLLLRMILRCEKNKKHNTRRISWIMVYALESFKS